MYRFVNNKQRSKMKKRRQSQKKLPQNSSTALPTIQQKRPPIPTQHIRKMPSTAKSTQKRKQNEQATKQSSTSISKMPQLLKTKRTFSSLQLPYNLRKEKEYKKYDISAQAYGIYRENLTSIIEYNVEERREIASLTKMMTMMTVLRLSQKYNVQIKSTYFRVSVNAANVVGTVAELDPKQWVTVQDLLYALMLPSGNDAAIALAQNFGAYIYYQKQGESKALSQIKSLDVTNDSSLLRQYSQNFIKQMNILSKQYQLQNTLFMNPHGLDCKQAYSTVKDLSIITSKVVQNPIAEKIICCKNYFARLKISIGKKEVCYREIDWMNTHRLIWKKGFIGGKTGQTNSAGACLATIFEQQGKKYFIIVLGCQSREDRFIQTEKLVNQQILKAQ